MTDLVKDGQATEQTISGANMSDIQEHGPSEKVEAEGKQISGLEAPKIYKQDKKNAVESDDEDLGDYEKLSFGQD